MIKRKFMQFFAPEGAPVSVASILGEPDTEADDKNLGGEETPVVEEEEAPVVEEGGTPTVKKTEAPAPFDAERFAQVFGAEIAKAMPKPAETKVETPKLTVEEAKKLANHFDITDEFLAEFGDIKTQKQALEKMRDGIVRNVVTLMQMAQGELKQNFDKRWEIEFQPMREQQQIATVQAAEKEFDTTFPQLSNEALIPVKAAVAEHLHKSGKLVGTRQQQMTIIAKGVESVIKASNPTFKLVAAKAATTVKKSNSNEIASETIGGGGGGAGGNTDDSKRGPSKLVGLLPQIK